MIEHLLNQTAIWSKKIGLDKFSKPMYGEPLAINVRWEDSTKLVKGPDGRETLSNAFIMTIDDVYSGDKLEYKGRAWTVLITEGVPDGDGIVYFKEVYV